MPHDYVFVGPTLPAAEVTALLPGATPLPPIRHGDLLRLAPRANDRVLIIDGLFLLTAPIRHKELLDALDRGVVVAGSSSMGALRAAELWPYGMRGVGRIFEFYRDGVVTDDDEVTIVHGPADEGHRPLSEPLVNLRVSLAAAVDAGVLDPAGAHALLDCARQVPFRARGPRMLRRRAYAAGLRDSHDRYAAWAAAHPMDAKADDARELLRLAAAGDPRLRPRDDADTPIESVGTVFFEAWRTRHHGATVGERWVNDAKVINALMILHPEFPVLHRRHVLRLLVGADPRTPLPEVERRALDLARQRGLTDEGIAGSGWLTADERELPAAEAMLRVLVRAFGTVNSKVLPYRCLPPELAGPDVLERTRRIVASALRLTDRLPHPDPHRPLLRLRYRPAVVDEVLCRLWGCRPETLEAAGWDRGFGDLGWLRGNAEPLVSWLKVATARPEPWYPPTGTTEPTLVPA